MKKPFNSSTPDDTCFISDIDLSLSILIPAYNEEENILNTLNNVYYGLYGLDIKYEIIIIDDGSTDNTAILVQKNIEKYPNVFLLRNGKNKGFGYSYHRGVQNAKMKYTVMVHGDNAWGKDTLHAFFKKLGTADVVIGYTKNMWHSRHWTRTFISKSFTLLMNAMLKKNLHYYNGLQIHRSKILKQMKIKSKGYSFQAEVLIKGLRHSTSYVEVGMELMERELGITKAFKIKNILEVLTTIPYLVFINYARISI